MLAVEEHGATYQMFAPNRNQYHVLNHLDGTEMHEQRNMLVEAARIARGNILPLEDFNANRFDAVIFPGGFGVAKNFFNYAFKGVDCEVDEQIAHIIKSVHQAGKPIGALCISHESEISIYPDIVQIQVFVSPRTSGILGDDILAVPGKFDGFDGAGSVRDLILADHPFSIPAFLVAGRQSRKR